MKRICLSNHPLQSATVQRVAANSCCCGAFRFTKRFTVKCDLIHYDHVPFLLLQLNLKH